MNEEDVIKGLIVLSELYGRQISDTTLQVFANAIIEELTPDVACKAMSMWMKSGKGFPSISDLIEISKPKKGSIAAAVEESLNQMQARIAAGTEKIPVTRLAAHAWNELGGWDVIGQMPIDPGRHPQAYDSFIKRMRSTLWGVVERFKNGSIEDDKLIIYMKPYDGSMPPSSALLDASNELN